MVNTPLYNAQDGKFENGHLGLWHDKFCNEWNQSFNALQSKENSKKNWINEIVIKPTKDHADATRLINLVGIDNTVCYTTTEPMIVGMGLSHPVENGMLFHHTLGVPYLPGSSVKGLVRAWAENWEEDKTEQFKRIFGSDSKSDTKTQAGSIIFFDALPIEPITLKADIMTPHYNQYYSSQGKEPPADNDKPTPISFLVVKKGARFQFAFKARKKSEDSTDDLVKVEQWLEQALKLLGAGAKTAVGYGRMIDDEEIKSQNQERLAEKEEQKKQQQKTKDIQEQAKHNESNKWLVEKVKFIAAEQNCSQEEAFMKPMLVRLVETRSDKKYLAKVVLDKQEEHGLKAISNKEKRARLKLSNFVKSR